MGLDELVELAEDLLWLDSAIRRHIFLEEHVQAGVRVDFHEPGVHFLIQQDIHAEDLEVLRALVICVHLSVVLMDQVWLHGDDGFLDRVLDLLLDELDVVAQLLEHLPERGE